MDIRSVIVASCLASSAPLLAQEPKREQVGEVLGKPVYRDQLNDRTEAELESDLHRVFSGPLYERLAVEHRAEVVPTEQELDATTAYFDREHEQRIAPQAEQLRTELAEIEARLKAPDVSDDERESLQRRKWVVEVHLKPPGRMFAEFMLSHWKLERYLYLNYGGGRLLWQQAGVEAFDATRRFLEEQEKQGAFKINDRYLRRVFYTYWTSKNHGVFLFDDPARIRDEFLNPPWAPAAQSQPMSQPTSVPATQRS